MGQVGRDLSAGTIVDVLKKYDLVATMVPGAGSIKQGLTTSRCTPGSGGFRTKHQGGGGVQMAPT
jgi:hypothetical protein